MKTIQMTLDQALIDEIDMEVKKLGTTRSAFTRKALRKYLQHLHSKELEEKHRRGYEKHPVEQYECGGWEKEQVWID
jgi:metal-responsive CopG/Arc/MetJ family transcriptional regulator